VHRAMQALPARRAQPVLPEQQARRVMWALPVVVADLPAPPAKPDHRVCRVIPAHRAKQALLVLRAMLVPPDRRV
jgi:hypothetical protein